MASIVAAYPAIASAITASIHDSNMETLDKFMNFLVERIEGDVDEMKEFLADFKKKLASDFETESKKIKKSNKAVKTEKKKRGATGYSLFIGMQMKKIREENPTMDGKEVMAEAMKYWSSLTPEEKEKYTKEAKAAKATTESENSKITIESEPASESANDDEVEQPVVEEAKPKKASKKAEKTDKPKKTKKVEKVKTPVESESSDSE